MISGFPVSPEREKEYKKALIPIGARVLCFGDPDGNRTRVTAVKGRCLSRLTTGPLVAEVGLEPTTYRV